MHCRLRVGGNIALCIEHCALCIGIKSHISLALVDDACGECAELQLAEQCSQCFHVGRLALQCLFVPLDGHVGLDGGQPLALANLFDVLLDVGFECALELVGVLQQILDRSKLLYERFGLFGTHPGATGDVVGSVAHQSQQVDDLEGRLKSILLLDLLDTQDFALCRVV